jgi:hypothetical protein
MEFTYTEFLSAKDKALVFKQWKSFMKFLSSGEWKEWNNKQGGSDYGMEAPKVFTKNIYLHLSLHCGFIAHFNIHGFYSEYFSGSQVDIERFFKAIESWGEYTDITDAMRAEYGTHKDKITAQFKEETDDRFDLIKELVKRAEGDLEFRTKLVDKLL